MKERPILFSAPMVRALLDGSKTQTRRIAKPAFLDFKGQSFFNVDKSPYGVLGDRLWVRETHTPIFGQTCGLIEVDYKADPRERWERMQDHLGSRKWTPSIHMRREYSRITLEIVSVRVERLQDITEDDAIAEGVDGPMCAAAVGRAPSRFKLLPAAVHGYSHLWETINGAGSWDANPWVWAVEFRRMEG